MANDEGLILFGIIDDEKMIDISRRVYDPKGLSPTIHTCGGGGQERKIVEFVAYDEQNRYIREDGCVGAITTDGSSPKHNNRIIESNIRIRKLTPRECWRLMDFDDEDFDKAEKTNSNSQLYKQAGNSIVVNCLVAIIGQMFVGHENDYRRESNGKESKSEEETYHTGRCS